MTVGKSGLYHGKVGVFADVETTASRSAEALTRPPQPGLGSPTLRASRFSLTGSVTPKPAGVRRRSFDETWHGLRRNLNVTSVEDAARVIREHVPAEPLDEIVASLRAALTEAEFHPDAISLRTYQSEVLDSWEAAGHRGIVTFATGGGKTRVALEAVRRWTAQGRPALILVPSELLHRQWETEISEMLGNPAPPGRRRPRPKRLESSSLGLHPCRHIARVASRTRHLSDRRHRPFPRARPRRRASSARQR